MSIVLRMAGVAIRWRILKYQIVMAAGASYAGMRSRQFEGGRRVIETGGRPSRRGVAGRTGGSQLALMDIILRVAGVAVRGGPFEDIVDVAIHTSHQSMPPHQFEDG